MKKLFISLLALGLSFSFNAAAISIDLIANQSAINLGDSIEVQVRISGLTDADAPALGAYDVNFIYDANLFSVNSIQWGDPAKGNQLDLQDFGSLQDSNNSIGWLNLFELSLDDALNLESLQAGEFTLFSVLLNAVAIGSGDFSLTATTLSDAYGESLWAGAINRTRITVGDVAVPEPSSLLLLLGMLAIVTLRIKLSQSQK